MPIWNPYFMVDQVRPNTTLLDLLTVVMSVTLLPPHHVCMCPLCVCVCRNLSKSKRWTSPARNTYTFLWTKVVGLSGQYPYIARQKMMRSGAESNISLSEFISSIHARNSQSQCVCVCVCLWRRQQRVQRDVHSICGDAAWFVPIRAWRSAGPPLNEAHNANSTLVDISLEPEFPLSKEELQGVRCKHLWCANLYILYIYVRLSYWIWQISLFRWPWWHRRRLWPHMLVSAPHKTASLPPKGSSYSAEVGVPVVLLDHHSFFLESHISYKRIVFGIKDYIIQI